MLLTLLGVLLLQIGACADSGAESTQTKAPAVDTTLSAATFAGGCFWCMEPPFEELPGVQSVVSGYAGGEKPNPTYEEVSAGRTSYVEAVRVRYDSSAVSYEALLDAYWRHIDPTDAGGQFADRGPQYRPVIFFHSERQQHLARASRERLGAEGPFDAPIQVAIEPLTTFYRAEEYHQDYYRKHPARYKSYFEASGRGPFLRRVWGEGS